MGEESQNGEEQIAGRTTDKEFHTFFNEKTFGFGEAGEAPECPWGAGLKARMGPLTVCLVLQTAACGLCSRRSC